MSNSTLTESLVDVIKGGGSEADRLRLMVIALLGKVCGTNAGDPPSILTPAQTPTRAHTHTHTHTHTYRRIHANKR